MDGTSTIEGRVYLMEVKAINVGGTAKTQKATIRRECMERKLKTLKQHPKGTRVMLVTVDARSKRYNLWRGLGSPRIDSNKAKAASVSTLAQLKKQVDAVNKVWKTMLTAGNKYPDEK
jgi:hypothetical protein